MASSEVKESSSKGHHLGKVIAGTVSAIQMSNYMTELKQVKVSIQVDGKMEMSALMHACFLGDLTAAQQAFKDIERRGHRTLLEAELRRRDSWAGSTPLHWAAYSGNVALIEELLCRGADVNEANNRDQSLPIHLAARFGRADAVYALVRKEVSQLAITNSLGSTPLHEAAFEGHPEVISTLIDLRANIEARNNEQEGGLTPLLCAAEYGHLESVRVLLHAGANPNTKPLSTTNREPASA